MVLTGSQPCPSELLTVDFSGFVMPHGPAPAGTGQCSRCHRERSTWRDIAFVQRREPFTELRGGFIGAAAVLAAIPASTVLPIGGTVAAAASAHVSAGGCVLNSPSGTIKHVISLVFDNLHFSQDNPNVPSDLAQMPNLLNFHRRQRRGAVERAHAAHRSHRG